MPEWKNLTSEEVWNFGIQATLLSLYFILMVRFFLTPKQWPMGMYYLGCLWKDGGVMFMGLFLSGVSK